MSNIIFALNEGEENWVSLGDILEDLKYNFGPTDIDVCIDTKNGEMVFLQVDLQTFEEFACKNADSQVRIVVYHKTKFRKKNHIFIG